MPLAVFRTKIITAGDLFLVKLATVHLGGNNQTNNSTELLQ